MVATIMVRLSVAQYNILGRYFAFTKYFSYAKDFIKRNSQTRTVESEFLEWDGPQGRKALLLRTLQSLNSDVLCCCEMDTWGEFEPELKRMGYSGVFASRPEKRQDGCCIWVRAPWMVEHSSRIIYSSTERVALRCDLVDHEDRRVSVVATHLYWNRSDPRQLTEMKELCDFLQEIRRPLILCGDFNNVLGSDALNMLGSLDHVSVSDSQGFQVPTTLTPDLYYWSKGWKRKLGRCEAIDHIFYKGLTLVEGSVKADEPLLSGNMELLPEEQQCGKEESGWEPQRGLKPEKGVPNQANPSDHFPVFAVFEV